MAEIPNIPHQVEMGPLKNIEAKVKADIINWIKEISKSRPELGDFSVCPFAKKAKYEILKIDIDKLYPIDGFDVIIYVLGETDLETINWWVEFYNKKYNDWIFFEDCASYDTYINGVQTNNGKHNLILGQPKEKLNKFRDILKKTDYYSYWDKDYYKEIMGSDCES
jgi:hypothetical protein